MRDARVRRIREALEWISGRLDEAGVPYQVAGGLAAIAHGASRRLNDIDVYVPEGALEELRSALADHHHHGPRRYRDEQWDCYFMEVRRRGEEIELPVMPLEGLVAYKSVLSRPVDREDLAELAPGD